MTYSTWDSIFDGVKYLYSIEPVDSGSNSLQIAWSSKFVQGIFKSVVTFFWKIYIKQLEIIFYLNYTFEIIFRK